jgi:hypothetical protein
MRIIQMTDEDSTGKIDQFTLKRGKKVIEMKISSTDILSDYDN